MTVALDFIIFQQSYDGEHHQGTAHGLVGSHLLTVKCQKGLLNYSNTNHYTRNWI